MLPAEATVARCPVSRVASLDAYEGDGPPGSSQGWAQDSSVDTGGLQQYAGSIAGAHDVDAGQVAGLAADRAGLSLDDLPGLDMDDPIDMIENEVKAEIKDAARTNPERHGDRNSHSGNRFHRSR